MEANVFIGVVHEWKLASDQGYVIVVPKGRMLELAIGDGGNTLVITDDGSRVTYTDHGIFEDHPDYQLFIPWSEIKSMKLSRSQTASAGQPRSQSYTR